MSELKTGTENRMDNVGYLALSHASMMGRGIDATANNIANANTSGFRSVRASFEKMITDTHSGDPMSEMAYAIDRGTWNDMSHGAMLGTGNPLDMAVQGDGHFGYRRADGMVALGNDGSFAVNAEGALVTASGANVLDAGGAPINIPADAGRISVASDGTMSGENGAVFARIGVFSAPGIDRWKRLDGAMMAPRDGDVVLVPSVQPQVAQGVAEGSNVSPVLEMTRMIEQQRAYERSLSLADGANELRQQTIQRLGGRS